MHILDRAGGLRNGNAGVCQHLEDMLEGTEIPAFSSCHFPFYFTRGREVLFKVRAIENTCKSKPRKVATILLPSLPDKLLQGLEGTAGSGNLPNSNLQEQNGVQGSNTLVPHPGTSQLEHRREQSQCCHRRSRDMPGHISPSKKHLADGARVLTAELPASG